MNLNTIRTNFELWLFGDNQKARALYDRGNTNAEKGNYDKAIEDLEAVLKIDPNDISIKQSLEEVRQRKAEKE